MIMIIYRKGLRYGIRLKKVYTLFIIHFKCVFHLFTECVLSQIGFRVVKFQLGI